MENLETRGHEWITPITFNSTHSTTAKQITITGDTKYSSRGAITNEVKIVNEIRAPEWRAFDARWDH